ncbi:50S ribosomal protein L1 [bacterium]|nr:50S ribosomal protein L1 [bacterium]
MRRGKKYKEVLEKVEKGKTYLLETALNLVKKIAPAKFDESIDIDIKLGVDPKDSSQMVRGTVVLPHGRGKKIKVLVFAKGEQEKAAKGEGADFVGTTELIEKINKGWLDFDVAIATPDMMKEIARLGRILGPKGLMPNPKLGTVTLKIAQAVKEAKTGRIEYRMDSQSILHLSIGKKSFKEENLSENILALLGAVVKSRPATAKGQYLKKATLSSTMGPSIRIDTQDLIKRLTREGI